MLVLIRCVVLYSKQIKVVLLSRNNGGITMPTAKLRTSGLLNRLNQASDPKQFFASNEEHMNMPAFSAFIAELARSKSVSHQKVISLGNIENSFGHQVFKGTRNSSRDTVIAIAFGFEADLTLAQELLKHARCAQLYPRVPRDAALIYCFQHKIGIVDAQCLLSELELPLLGGGK